MDDRLADSPAVHEDEAGDGILMWGEGMLDTRETARYRAGRRWEEKASDDRHVCPRCSIKACPKRTRAERD